MSSPLPVVTGPFEEWQETYTPNADGSITVEWPLTPSGDRATVQGTDRLVQDIQTFWYMAVGADITQPTAGNILFDDIEQPSSGDASVYDEQVNQVLQNFMQFQANDAAQGWLSLDEQLDTYDFTCTFINDGLALQVDLTVTAKDGNTDAVPPLTAPLS